MNNIYKGIAGKVRRKILMKLSRECMTVGSIADGFDLSRPAISRHLRVLKESGLIKVKKDGRARVCYINPEALKKLSLWIHNTLAR